MAMSATEKATAFSSLLLLGIVVALSLGFSQRQSMTSPPLAVSNDSIAATAAPTIVDPDTQPKEHAKEARKKQLEERFEQAAAMLHAKQYDYAITALHRVLALAPRMPEAHVNMGYALIGLEQYKAAMDFFNTAIELQPYQGNAYWGLAASLEKQGDLEGAMGAMRTYIHLAKADDPFVRKARSALWEWETSLKRGPLPTAEKEWIERRTKEMEDANSPAADTPIAAEQSLK